jgi:hypothetical protein
MQQHEADRTIHVVNIVVHIRHLRQESVRHFLKKRTCSLYPVSPIVYSENNNKPLGNNSSSSLLQ